MNGNGELPSNWTVAKLGDLFEFEYGKGLIRKNRVESGSYPVYGSNGIVGFHNEFLIDGPVLIVGRKGAAGAVSYSADSCWPIDTTYFVRENENLHTKFSYYLLKSANLAKHEKSTAIPGLNRNDAYDETIFLPPLPEQRRIVAKIEELFTELDAGIASLRAAQAQLKTYRQALLKHAFEGKLTAAWRAENAEKLEPAAVLLRRIADERQSRYAAGVAEWEAGGKTGRKPRALKDVPTLSAAELTDLPALPAGWAWVKVGQMCDVVRGGSPRPAGNPKYYEGKIPFLKVADVTHSSSPYLHEFTYTIKEAGLAKTRLISPKTLLLSNSGATLGVPKICMIEATMNDGIAAFLGLPPDRLLYHYYFWQSKTSELRAINQGAAQPNLNTNLIQEIAFPFCSVSEQKQLIEEVESRFSVIDQLEQTITSALQQAESLRQSILQKAFAGQLVPQDENDEPASALLARIRAARA
jgi:type I restriction enzyme, S subunit